jgi:hypothetical protein
VHFHGQAEHGPRGVRQGVLSMVDIRPHSPVLLFLAAFSRHEEALQWAEQQAVEHWGPVALASEVFSFDQTDYYEPSMGPDLKKILMVFERLIEPNSLVDIKLQTGQWEAEYRQSHNWPEPRPLNLDPGYLTEAKLVLATTKDRNHRLYLDRGIFRRGDAVLPAGRRLAGARVDVSRLPDPRLPSIPESMSRLSSQAHS